MTAITDELRTYARGYELYVNYKLLEIADRIDAEHQKAMDEWKARNGQMWLKGYSECRAEIAEGNDAIVRDLEANGWVRLPVDADGEPIHVGDLVEDADVREITERVMQIRYTLATAIEAPSVLVSIITDASQLPQKPDYYRHHRAPTVEDVLREFADRVCSSGHQWGLDAADTIAKYAAQLRLADGWTRLPLDADGVPIHIGDYLHCDETGMDFPCRGYCCSVGENGERRWTVECSYDAYSGTSEYVSARRCHHHHAPTVEDVLREFADRVCSSGHQWGLDAADTIAKYAAQLRLADESDTL